MIFKEFILNVVHLHLNWLITLINCIAAISVVISILLLVAYSILLERKVLGSIQRRRGPNLVGILGLLQPIADAVKLIMKETIIPVLSNKIIFILAPILSLILSLLNWSIIPFSNHGIYADIRISILMFFAISSLTVYGIIMSGWASNSKYAFLGALRAAAQVIAYEVTIGLTLIYILLYANSLNYFDIVLKQVLIWNFISCNIFFFLFFISTLAETNRPPFDLPEAEAELVSGYNVEYSAMSFGFFFLGEYVSIWSVSCLNVIFFWGGVMFWDFESLFIYSLKCIGFIILFIWVRASVPRYRYDQLMRLGWKILLPLTLGFLILFNGIYYIISFNFISEISLYTNFNRYFLYWFDLHWYDWKKYNLQWYSLKLGDKIIDLKNLISNSLHNWYERYYVVIESNENYSGIKLRRSNNENCNGINNENCSGNNNENSNSNNNGNNNGNCNGNNNENFNSNSNGNNNDNSNGNNNENSIGINKRYPNQRYINLKLAFRECIDQYLYFKWFVWPTYKEIFVIKDYSFFKKMDIINDLNLYGYKEIVVNKHNVFKGVVYFVEDYENAIEVSKYRELYKNNVYFKEKLERKTKLYFLFLNHEKMNLNWNYAEIIKRLEIYERLKSYKCLSKDYLEIDRYVFNDKLKSNFVVSCLAEANDYLVDFNKKELLKYRELYKNNVYFKEKLERKIKLYFLFLNYEANLDGNNVDALMDVIKKRLEMYERLKSYKCLSKDYLEIDRYVWNHQLMSDFYISCLAEANDYLNNYFKGEISKSIAVYRKSEMLKSDLDFLGLTKINEYNNTFNKKELLKYSELYKNNAYFKEKFERKTKLYFLFLQHEKVNFNWNYGEVIKRLEIYDKLKSYNCLSKEYLEIDSYVFNDKLMSDYAISCLAQASDYLNENSVNFILEGFRLFSISETLKGDFVEFNNKYTKWK